jgi:cobalt-zinc-cadmium efflux system outer membrane protein
MWTAALLALGMSTAVAVAGDPHPPALPAHVVEAERPPEKQTRYEVGFEPWGLEEASATPVPAPVAPPATAAPMPVPSGMPSNIPTAIPEAMRPAPVASAPVTTMSTAMTPQQAKAGAVSLVALERMVLNRFAAPKQQSADGQRLTLQPVNATEPNDTILLVAQGFVDHIVAAGASPTPPDQVTTLTQEYRLLNAVRLHYYHLLALERLIAVREEIAGICRDAVSTIESMTASGQATKAELLHARIEAREQMAALQTAKATHDAVWHRLAMLVGQPDMPIGTLEGDVEQSCSVPAMDASWTHLLDASPELKTVRAELNRRQTSLRQNLTGSGKVSNDKSNSETYFGQAVASLAGGAFANREPQVKSATWNEVSQLEGEVGRVQQSLRTRLVDSYLRHDRAKDLVELYRSQNLPDAKEAFELSVIGFRRGQGSWPEVQIAQRNYFRMSNEYVEALADLRRAELVILGLVLDVPEETQPVAKPSIRK